MEYGQFCPIAKATEVIGEKWTILIIRELLMGGSRFNELQRGLSLISPSILSKRLESLSKHGLVLKKKIPGQKGFNEGFWPISLPLFPKDIVCGYVADNPEQRSSDFCENNSTVAC